MATFPGFQALSGIPHALWFALSLLPGGPSSVTPSGVFNSPAWKNFMLPWKSRPKGRSTERAPYTAGGISSLRGGMPLFVLVPELKVFGSLAVAGTACRPGSVSARGMMDDNIGVAAARRVSSRKAMIGIAHLSRPNSIF